MRAGLFMRTEKSIFHAIPWGTSHWLLGDTDTEWDGDPEQPVASRADVTYVLAKLNSALVNPVTPRDVQGVFAGVRPLVKAAGSADTTRLSREHRLFGPRPGMTVIAGGKYTTYRVMARDAVDRAVRGLGRDVPPSRTQDVPLLGAVDDLPPAPPELSGEQARRLVKRHGSEAGRLFQLITGDPRLAAPLPGAESYPAAEAVYACTHQGALTLDDILARRTRIAIEVADRGRTAAAAIVPLVAPLLGWSETRGAEELAAYRRLRDAERAGESADNDAGAVAGYRQALAPGP